MDFYEKQRMLGRTEQEFEIFATFSFMHELEHFAYTEVGGSMVSLETTTVAEKVAWAHTCEYTIRPMVEKYGFRLLSSESLYYNSWIWVARNVNDHRWEQFIREQYASTR